MRYLMLIAIVIVACSFTIREKLVKKDNGWEMYVYPDFEDSTTYFKQIYYLKDIYREKNKRGEWIDMLESTILPNSFAYTILYVVLPRMFSDTTIHFLPTRFITAKKIQKNFTEKLWLNIEV